MSEPRKPRVWIRPSTNPTTAEDSSQGYRNGDLWVRTSSARAWVLADAEDGTWVEAGAGGGGGGAVSDGDYGDVEVSGTGSDWTVQSFNDGTAFGNAAGKNTGTTAGTVAEGNHDHTGVYDPAGTAASAVSAHAAAGNPHPVYLTQAEGDAAYDAIGAASSAVAAHEGEPDPHTGYQLRDEKGDPDGYAGLNGSGVVPHAQLGTGGGTGTVYLRDDGTWGTPTGTGLSEADVQARIAFGGF